LILPRGHVREVWWAKAVASLAIFNILLHVLCRHFPGIYEIFNTAGQFRNEVVEFSVEGTRLLHLIK
jgi:hypothetical protein